MTIAVIGIGLIGGSLVVDLRKRGFADKIIGVDTNLHHQNIALLCGLVDENDTLENAIEKSDLIILSTPVNTNCTHAARYTRQDSRHFKSGDRYGLNKSQHR